jgi:hypothetical protein
MHNRQVEHVISVHVDCVGIEVAIAPGELGVAEHQRLCWIKDWLLESRTVQLQVFLQRQGSKQRVTVVSGC